MPEISSYIEIVNRIQVRSLTNNFERQILSFFSPMRYN